LKALSLCVEKAWVNAEFEGLDDDIRLNAVPFISPI
jgi:hypothetical protein